MLKSVVLFVSGCLGGAIATYLLFAGSFLKPDAGPERDLHDDANIAITGVDAHRANRFASINTIEDVLSLPTDHSETEALYALAGRSSSGQLQYLLEQANRMAHRGERLAAQKILLARLTELDPVSALAITNQSDAADASELAYSVWSAWASADFTAAIDAARQLPNSDRRLAAEALYSAVGLQGAEAELLEEQLGLTPGQRAISTYLENLAAESPVDAVTFLESLSGPFDGMTLIETLARVIATHSGSDHATVLAAFTDPVHRQLFQQQLSRHRALDDPEALLQDALAGQSQVGSKGGDDITLAMSALARQDLELAIGYLEQIQNRQAKQNAYSSVAAVMAAEDPDRALDWLRAQGLTERDNAYSSVLSTIARTDPKRAMTVAQSMVDPGGRYSAVSSIAYQVARFNPGQASEVVDIIDDVDLRHSLVRNLSSMWVQSEHQAALAWAKTLNAPEQALAVNEMVSRLLDMDVNTAMSAIEALPDAQQRNFRPQVARKLAEQSSIADAQAYIAQFEGDADFPQMQAALVASLLQRDPQQAQHQIASVADARLRDQLRAGLVPLLARTDSGQALQVLEQITEPTLRRQAMSSLSSTVFANDPTTADEWLRSLPPGKERDWATSAAARRTGLSTEKFREYLAMIGDEDARRSAQISHVIQLARVDREAALEMIEEIDLTEEQRSQFLRTFDQMTNTVSLR